jgi:hypothetical protein
MKREWIKIRNGKKGNKLGRRWEWEEGFKGDLGPPVNYDNSLNFSRDGKMGR